MKESDFIKHDYMYEYQGTSNALNIPAIVSHVIAITCLVIFCSVGLGKMYSVYEIRNQEYVRMTPELKEGVVDEYYQAIMIEEESRP